MNVIRGNLNTSGKGDHCQMARIGHRHFEKFVVTDFFSWHWILLLAVQNGQIDDNLIMGHSCIVRAILIEQTLYRLPALLQLLFVQVTFGKLRKPICCFFSWCVFFSLQPQACRPENKEIDWLGGFPPPSLRRRSHLLCCWWVRTKCQSRSYLRFLS